MPWNDNANPGPWGSPPSSSDDEPRPKPGRRPPSPPPPPPGPDFSEVFRRARAGWGRLTRSRHADRLTGRIVGLGAAGAAALWILSGFYVVQPFEKAIVTRFGAYDRTETPGLRYHLPIPIEQAEPVNVINEQKLVIGAEGGSEAPGESLMLTADENIVDVVFAVQYRIVDPAAWLFQVRDPEGMVRTVGETAVREVVGRSDLTSVLTEGRGHVQAQARGLMQQILNRYHAGVIIDAVQIQSANPPPEVAPAYQDVTRAGEDAQTAGNVANAYASKTTSDAQSAAAKITLAASIYQQQVVHEANGEASRFDQIYGQYRRAPEVTRERLYIQTMEDVLAHAHVVIIGAKGAQIVLSSPAPSSGPAQPLAPSPLQGGGSSPAGTGSQP
ncbi:MAG TPA: FtsH protease activity modulator HflK [Caulobacteraceae bacterium]